MTHLLTHRHSFFISLKCQFFPPNRLTLDQKSTRVANLNATLARMAKSKKCLWPSSSKQNEDFSGGGNFYDFDLSCLHSGQNSEPTVNFFLLFISFRLISQARKVEMTHF